jgi:hypothetical protein
VGGVDSTDSVSDGAGVDFALDEDRREVAVGTGVASAFVAFVPLDGVFLAVDSESASSGSGVDEVRDFFFAVEDDDDFELVALGVFWVVASSSFEESAGVGFGVDLRAWELPDFFFDSAPAAIRTKLKNKTRSVRALRVME